MSLRWFHRLGLTIIDKAIIAIVIVIVSLDVSQGFSQLGVNIIVTVLLVLILYGLSVFIASIPKWLYQGEGRWTNILLGGISALFVLLLFPTLLEGFFWLANMLGWLDYELRTPLRNILLITFVLRAFLKGYLSRRWGKNT